MSNSVTFPVALGGDGSTVTDDANPDTGLANDGHLRRLIPAFSQTIKIAGKAVEAASELARDQAIASFSVEQINQIISNTVVSYLGQKQPDNGDVSVFYTPLHIVTQCELGQDFVASLSTTDHFPIWEVEGVETKAVSLTLAGTGTPQNIT